MATPFKFLISLFDRFMNSLRSNASEKDSLLRVDGLDGKHVSAVKSVFGHKTKHQAKACRAKAIAAGRICPVCKGVLIGPRNGMPIDPRARTKLYLVRCSNNHQLKKAPKCAPSEEHKKKLYRCHFSALLTEREFRCFKDGM